jgi:hypothetical protein
MARLNAPLTIAAHTVGRGVTGTVVMEPEWLTRLNVRL